MIKMWALKKPYPYIVCLVGSTKPKWRNKYREILEKLTLKGFVVHTVVWFHDEIPDFEKNRELFERIHFHKIRISDAVVIIDKDAIGDHTKLEIDFAIKNKKPIILYEDDDETPRLIERRIRKEPVIPHDIGYLDQEGGLHPT